MINQVQAALATQGSLLLSENVLDVISKIYIVPNREEFRHGDDFYIQNEEIMYALSSAVNDVKWTQELINELSSFSGVEFAKFCNIAVKEREKLDCLGDSVPRLMRVRARAFQLMLEDSFNSWALHISAESEVNTKLKSEILELITRSEMKDVMSVLGAWEHCSLGRKDAQILGEKFRAAKKRDDVKQTISVISEKYTSGFVGLINAAA